MLKTVSFLKVYFDKEPESAHGTLELEVNSVPYGWS